MKTEYDEKGGCLQRDSVEHKEYTEAYSPESREVDRKDGADLLEKVLSRDNLNKAYKRVKANKGASGVDGMTVDEALPWLKEHREELLAHDMHFSDLFNECAEKLERLYHADSAYFYVAPLTKRIISSTSCEEKQL